MSIERLLPALHQALGDLGLGGADRATLVPLPAAGLAHDHVRVEGTGLLLRVPKQSQLALDAAANLAYQAACFERAGAGGHTPRLHAVIPPGPALPMGALVVDEIVGRPPVLPAALPALAEALARIHALPVPPPATRPPLRDPADPVADTLAEIRRQAVHLDAAGLHRAALAQVRAELDWADGLAGGRRTGPGVEPGAGPVTLISFDAHPGNFLIDAAGRAVLVDLEKARYGAPGLDLAHATLYTSTTWDIATSAVLGHDDIAAFYRTWLDAAGPAVAGPARPWLLPLRRLMWLWSATWCAKWWVLSQAAPRAAAPGGSTEDWSAALSDPSLVAHVAERVAHYLDPDTIALIRRDWLGDHALTRLLGACD